MDPFHYTYRWQQIINRPVDEQITLLESRDRSLEKYMRDTGRCTLELPYRWDQIMPGLALGEDWAISCAEENDRTIEALFANCQCAGGFTVTFTGTNNQERFAEWEDAFSLGFTQLTLTRITLDMSFYEDDRCFVQAFLSNLDLFEFLNWGEGNYDPSGVGAPDRDTILNLPGSGPTTVSLDDRDAGPYPALRDGSDPYFRPITDFVTDNFLHLADNPQTFLVDEFFSLSVDVLPDYGNIPGFTDDGSGPSGRDNPILAWNGNVTFHFAEAGDDIIVSL